jgi:hypothetical protein
MKLVEPRRLVRQTNKGRPNRVKKGINEKKYLPIFIHIIIITSVSFKYVLSNKQSKYVIIQKS